MPSILRGYFFCFVIPLIFLCSCSNHNDFIVNEFDPIVNFGNKEDTCVVMEADLSDAVLNGIQIPSAHQTPTGFFKFSFRIKNRSSDYKKYYYKIFFENSTYRFHDTDVLAHENFYGSWAEGLYTFKSTPILKPGEETVLADSFQIVGNPRNEKKYYGASPYKYLAIDDTIKSKMDFIRTVPEWMKAIKEKAKKEETTVEEQVYLNAMWSIGYEKERDKSTNNRWKRNPRMGTYEFMLVVTSPEDIGKIAMEVRDLQMLNKESGQFTNPFGYFLSGKAKQFTNTFISLSGKKLKVSSKLDLGSGIYIDKLSINKSGFSYTCQTQGCNNSPELFKTAQFKQYFHNIDKNYTVYNVPEIKDVVGENLTRAEYKMLEEKYSDKNKRVKMYVSTSDCPCATIKSDKKDNKLIMKNPAVETPRYRKEHVGLSSRLGYTYGKFRAKIKFPPMLSKDNVWNGLTNAFWLLFQEEGEWNNRRECNAEMAYIPKSEPDSDEALKHTKKSLSYSEIDFEIVKESQYWPKTSYLKSNTSYKTDDAFNNNEIMVTCTNWDMACHEPKLFNIGAQEYTMDGNKYIFHRWNHYYRALSTKIPVKHDEIFARPYYYFEIEWLPEKIVWKIGPEKDKMRVICVMDKNVSAIPNNQMMLMFTQEWHNEEWWPTAPFRQNFVPFPKKDLIGEILEIQIE